MHRLGVPQRMSSVASIGVIPSVVTSSRAAGWVIPQKGDPRVPFACILTTYAVLGCTTLGFNRTPVQILLTVAAGCLLDMGLHWLFCNRERLIPLSAFISMISIGLLLNYAHNYYLLFLPVFFTLISKYVLTFRGRHVFNPSLFGLVCALISRQRPVFIGAGISVGWFVGAGCVHDYGGLRTLSVSNWTDRPDRLFPLPLRTADLVARLYPS